jgi:hypothetical protein
VRSREGEGTTFSFSLPLRTRLPAEMLEQELDIPLMAEDTADEKDLVR